MIDHSRSNTRIAQGGAAFFLSSRFLPFLPSFLQPVQIWDLHPIDSTTKGFPQWFILRCSQNLRVHRIELYSEWWVWKGFGRKRPRNNRGRNSGTCLDRLSKTIKNLRLSVVLAVAGIRHLPIASWYLYCYSNLPGNAATCLKSLHCRIHAESKQARWPKTWKIDNNSSQFLFF